MATTGKNLTDLVNCGDSGDREAIIRLCVASAAYFNNKPTVKDINEALAGEHFSALTNDEVKKYNIAEG